MARHIRSAATIAALGLVAGLGVAAADGDCYVALEGDPATTEDDVLACEEQHWFHRSTSHGGNLGFVDPTGTHGLATFDTNPPAGSVSGGNGGGYVATQALDNDGDLLEAEFSGTFTGVIDSLDVDLHTLAGTESNQQGNLSLRVNLTVDGIPLFAGDLIDVPSEVEEASAAGSLRHGFAITGIASMLDRYNFANDADTTHEVLLEVGVHYTNHVVVFAFDTTEVPGGITFNAIEPDASVVMSVG